jgi:beta-galactosidase
VGSNVSLSFESQRAYANRGPLVNSEFYPGWLDLWGSPHSIVNTTEVLKTFNEMMQINANVNFYMFHGGTNFGFSNGADPPYLPQPTSYDYDAPISEAGDITKKYMSIRKAISQYLPIPKVAVPINSTKIALGNVQMTYYLPLIDAIREFSDKCVNSFHPLSFEKLGQGYGFISYSTILDDPNVDGQILSIDGLRDRAYVQIGAASLGFLYRVSRTSLKIDLKSNHNRTLYIIVENMGRLNFGNNLLDAKGILGNVTLNNATLTTWTQCLTKNFIPNYQMMNDKLWQRIKHPKNLLSKTNLQNVTDFKVPAIYLGEFQVSSQTSDFDTFLKMDKFKKGIALIRSSKGQLTNLGRYWPYTGPQVTLYTPGIFMTPAQAINDLILIEFEGSMCNDDKYCLAQFIDYPIIDSL